MFKHRSNEEVNKHGSDSASKRLGDCTELEVAGMTKQVNKGSIADRSKGKLLFPDYTMVADHRREGKKRKSRCSGQ